MLAYANFADLGINNGVLYEASRAKGSGDAELSKKLIDGGFSVTFFLGIIFSSLLFGISFFPLGLLEDNRFILRLTSLVIISTMLLNYFQIELRISERFFLLSFSSILSPIFSLAVSVLYVEILGKNTAEWMLFAWITGPISAMIFLAVNTKFKILSKINFDTITNFFKVGIPLTLLPLVLSTFIGIDRWVLVSIAEPELLGFYALGCTLGLAIYMIPNSLGIVLFSSFLQDSGSTERSKKEKDSLSMLVKSLVI